ncbi:MAG: CoA activase [Acidobacteria bacterium]|nr:MAG: CoA activase [Acidobacteriota bacterium]
MPRLLIGLDVGSTTVKALVGEESSDQIHWRDYQRHETKQPEKVLEFLRRMEADAGLTAGRDRIFMTGSGAGPLATLIGAKFVQEVTAVALAVEQLHPEVHSVVELGGQDAKIIVFKDGEQGGRKKKIPSMNDKCAGGTGAVIDKINAKLQIPPVDLCNQGYHGIKLHKVAGKCGVFAETDINSLQKAGTPNDELMASLFEAIVLQNLSVLTRGNTLRPHVLLLGGPNSFIRGLRECWQANIPRIWEERHVEIPPGAKPEDLIRVPDNAQYYAALGAIAFGRDEDADVGVYAGTAPLLDYLDVGRHQEKLKSGGKALVENPEELKTFREQFRPVPFTPATFASGDVVKGFLGLDGGSTSTKVALLDEHRQVLEKVYQLSKGNPIQDTMEVCAKLREKVEASGARLEILGAGTTGYAKDMLKDVLHADVALVETVAHTESAMLFYDDPHVIVDVGGQDIKLIVLKDGRVKDFKLNTQCSAGNGYFLQSTAEGFGIPVEKYADIAFAAETMPVFGYGCAVFMQSDIVSFQRQGWRAEEILAGLAAVLPKNVFLYVAGIPSLAALGSRFVLQGGTQNNLAAVKSEVDFIRSSFKGAAPPEIIIHQHCGESGAIGAAVEALRLWRRGKQTSFIGLDAVARIQYRTTRNEATRCYFCKNNCLRTFIDVQTIANAQPEPVANFKSKVPILQGEQRLIIATCEKGTVEELGAMKDIKAGLDKMRAANPNLVDLAAHEAFRPPVVDCVAEEPKAAGFHWGKAAEAAKQRALLFGARGSVRIGIPRVLNTYVYAPFYNGYLQALGIKPENIVYSDYTSPDLYRAGSSRGAIDPCFPAKIGIAHVHNLLSVKHPKKSLDAIFFAMVDVLHTPLTHLTGSNACPTVTATPETAKAAFIKESNLFAEAGVRFLGPVLDFQDHKLLAWQLFKAFDPMLSLTEDENVRAVEAGFAAMTGYETDMRRRARETLDQLEREDRVGLVMLGRPYHHDPGLNHEILDEFSKLGYPVFSQSLLPLDEDLLERLFGAEVRAGVIQDPLDISDVWKNSFSASTNHKVWAAKFTARHPNLVALEISSFKCGHDAPIYGVVEGIIESSGTPYFSFKDLDENKPTGSIRIRVETIDYFLRRYREDIADRRKARQTAESDIAARLAELERELRAETESNLVHA